MSADHNFTSQQRRQYDNLCAKGRTCYDRQRWFNGMTHGAAYAHALEVHGLKRQELFLMEAQYKFTKGERVEYDGAGGRTYVGSYVRTFNAPDSTVLFFEILVDGYLEPNWVEVLGREGMTVRKVGS